MFLNRDLMKKLIVLVTILTAYYARLEASQALCEKLSEESDIKLTQPMLVALAHYHGHCIPKKTLRNLFKSKHHAFNANQLMYASFIFTQECMRQWQPYSERWLHAITQHNIFLSRIGQHYNQRARRFRHNAIDYKRFGLLPFSISVVALDREMRDRSFMTDHWRR